MRAYQICSHCIMDTSDRLIRFDHRGWCDYCCNFYRRILPDWRTDAKAQETLSRQMAEIRLQGRQRDHDCIIGVSGGVDSSYLTYLVREKYGLKPLLYHVDAGWNSQQSVNNIEKLVDGLNLDLHTEVINWQEMRDLQLAFFRAQVPHLDTPQDHAFFGGLYNYAAKHGHKYILTGANYSTECLKGPLDWQYFATDLRHLRDIHQRFGKHPLATFPTTDILKYKLYYRYIKGIRVIKPLNFVPFVKEDAVQLLVARFGWQRYENKHYESRFTRFYEGYWLPTKFGFDTRRTQFSSLILTGQMSREEALARIARPAYDEETITKDFEYVAAKLDISPEELRRIMRGSNRSYRNFKNSMPLISLGTLVLKLLGLERRVIR